MALRPLDHSDAPGRGLPRRGSRGSSEATSGSRAQHRSNGGFAARRPGQTWVPFRHHPPVRVRDIRREGTPAVRLIYARRGARGAGVSRGPMQTDVETLPEDRVRLTVEVSAHDVDHAFEHALRDLAKDVRIPGFRKGKVPAKVVLARLGPEAVTEEALRTHLGSWYARAVTQVAHRAGRPARHRLGATRRRRARRSPSRRPCRSRPAPRCPTTWSSRRRASRSRSRRARSTASSSACAWPPPSSRRCRADTRRGAGPLRAHRLHGHARRQGAEGRERHRLPASRSARPPGGRARAGAARHEGRRDAAQVDVTFPADYEPTQGRRPHRAVRPAR